MALNAGKPKKTRYTYIPLIERNSENPFSVTFELLPISVLADIQDSALTIKEDNKGFAINVNKQNLNALRHGLKDWDNINDDEEAPLVFIVKAGLASMDSLEYIPQELRTEIGNVILKASEDPRNAEQITQ